MTTELKVVMFTDQIQSTQKTSQRTNSEIARIAREQDDLTSSVLRDTHGIILKDTGDGCLAQFSGVLEAVQAGVQLQQRVAARNAAQNQKQLCFDLHIAIDVGDLVVRSDGDLRGDAANRCARICAVCPPEDVYLSDLAAAMLKSNEVELERVGDRKFKGFEAKTRIFRVRKLLAPVNMPPNPFIWRGGITDASDFFNRDEEQQTIRTYVQGRQNCQIVGPRRIGKTSLLRQIERSAASWQKPVNAAYVDLQDPRCYSLVGCLRHIARQFQWSSTPVTLADFAECAEMAVRNGPPPLLCLDEFEALAKHRTEFTEDFFLTLRSCSQQGLSIITASLRQLIELTDRGDPSSPFYNIFPLVRLNPFNRQDSEDFINLHRPGTPPFDAEERAAILEFANGRPLALQVACFHVLDAKVSGKNLSAAMQKAAADMSAHGSVTSE